ncbi:MAG: rRNA maturation RNase YbeY [Dehalococcoidia bacterium]|nr:rRNA maturation RNase YbeY [Dehalococcoidia bacterium]
MAFTSPLTDFRIDVQIFDEFTNVVAEPSVLEVVAAALESESCAPDTHVSVVIADDEVVRELNRQHRGLDENTDVLSFSFTHEGEYYGEQERSALGADFDFVLPPGENDDPSLGEIIISYPQTCRQAEQAGHPVRQELTVLLVHGVLHLLGYDHEEPDDEAMMKAATSRAMGQMSPRHN